MHSYRGICYSTRYIVDLDLTRTIDRLRLKGEGSRWAAKRRRLQDKKYDFKEHIDPYDKEFYSRGKEIDCFLWMNTPKQEIPTELERFEKLGETFDTLADALEILRDLPGQTKKPKDTFEKTLKLAAEVQSMVRVAIQRVEGPEDQEVNDIHQHLKRLAGNHTIYIERHMTKDDPANPEDCSIVATELQDIRQGLVEEQLKLKAIKESRNCIKYHLRKVDQRGEDPSYHWKKIMKSVDELVPDYLPASSVELREILFPYIEYPIEDNLISQGYRRFLREVDRYLAQDPGTKTPPPPNPASSYVEEARKKVMGKRAVMVGGDVRENQRFAIEESLGLAELRWVETGEDTTPYSVQPHVRNDDIDLVLIAIKWIRHTTSYVVPKWCRRDGKPVVRLDGGYGVNQVAYQILQQVGERW